MEHAEDRPIPTFLASFDETSSCLTSNENVSQPMFVDYKNGKLFQE